jgi:predicted permease
MFQQFFKLTFRSFWRNKGFSFLNIAGLSAGMTVALLIGLWIADEFSYDRFHEKHDRIYLVKLTDAIDGKKATWTSVPLPIAEELRKSFPQVKHAVETDWGWEHGLKVGDNLLFEKGFQAGPDFLKMFTFPLVAGDLETALDDPASIVLTQEMASSLFGHENYGDILGQMVRLDNESDMKVTGVMENVPENSTLEFNFVVPFSHYENRENWVKNSRTNWKNNSFQVFFELQPGVTEAEFAGKIRNLIKEHVEESTTEVTLHACDDWRLYGKFVDGKVAGGFIEYVRLFGVIGGFVLFIACINFMNLSTARSERRSKEVGVRKTLGSMRRQLVTQFLGEAVLMAVIAYAFSLILAELALPAFNALTDKSLTTPYSNPVFWAMGLGFVLLTGLLAGSYPAFFLSSFKPVQVLKGNFARVGKAVFTPRKILVVSQFAISTALIVSTLVVAQQIRYAKNRPTGYDPNRLMIMTLSNELIDNYSPLKNELLASGYVSGMTTSNSPVTAVYSNSGIDWKGKNPDDRAVFATIATGDDYFSTLGIKLSEGRFFDKARPADSTAIIFNRSAIERMGMKNPLEQTIRWSDTDFRIIGVVEDVLMTNPYNNSQPTMYLQSPDWSNNLMFRLAPEKDTREALAYLETIFKKYNPAYPFDYKFADEEYARKFTREELIGKLAGLFGGLAIFISCLGLFGLAAYMAERRTKEIGIRKVLGASVANLWAILSREFVALVVLSILLATPIAAWLLGDWLERFDYRIGLQWWFFAAAGVAAIAVTLLTVSFQSIKAALANPVKSLRSE